MERRINVPVKVGDELNVNIEAVGEKGDGIAKVGGFVLFVPNTKEGDTVRIRITRVLRRVGFAEVIGQGRATSKKEKSEEEPEEEASEEESEDYGEEQEDEGSEEEPEEDTEDFGKELGEEKEY